AHRREAAQPAAAEATPAQTRDPGTAGAVTEAAADRAVAPQSGAVKADVEEASPPPVLREKAHQSPNPQELTLRAVQQHWESMIMRVGQEDRNLPALLAVSKPLAVEG